MSGCSNCALSAKEFHLLSISLLHATDKKNDKKGQEKAYFTLSWLIARICKRNGYTSTWMLHQIFIFSNKVKLAAGLDNDFSRPTSLPYPLSSYWMNEPINEFHACFLNWRQFFPCHNIHVYSTSTCKRGRYRQINVDTRFINIPYTFTIFIYIISSFRILLK